MSLKITLITPPDIFENYNTSILLSNISETAQAEASDWLGKFESQSNINIYYYQGEPEPKWFIQATASSKYKYIDVDNLTGVSKWFLGYLLGKPNVYYTTKDHNVIHILGCINTNLVSNITEFLEKTIGSENRT